MDEKNEDFDRAFHKKRIGLNVSSIYIKQPTDGDIGNRPNPLQLVRKKSIFDKSGMDILNILGNFLSKKYSKSVINIEKKKGFIEDEPLKKKQSQGKIDTYRMSIVSAYHE